MNYLFNADNMLFLTKYKEEFLNKINVIYIDPPYNTGTTDFNYNDKFADWDNFLRPRLLIAKDLLHTNGFIAISIDEREIINLRLLCDSIFGKENLVAMMPRKTKSAGNYTNKISINHDYILIYAKDINKVEIKGIPHVDEFFKFKDDHFETRGYYKLNQPLDCASLEYSATLDYPLEVGEEVLYPGGSYEDWQNRQNGIHQKKDWAWRWSKKLFDYAFENDLVVIKKYPNKKTRLYVKTYLNAKLVTSGGKYELKIQPRTKSLSSLQFTTHEYSNETATKELIKMFGKKVFDYPKSVQLLKDLVSIHNSEDTIVMDFFAGSGTTAQAVIELNNEFDTNKQFILCTNNENNICEEITKVRIDKVINGYTDSKGKIHNGINASYEYIILEEE